MLKRYLGLFLILLTLNLSGLALDYIRFSRVPNFKLDPARLNNSESKLAIGECIQLSSSDQYDLELIPGVGETFSDRIVQGRPEILKAATKLKPETSFQALEIVHGIGEKSAAEIGRYLCVR